MDILKRNVSHFITLFVWFTRREPTLLWGSMTVLGHTFPIFANFKGGKAVATNAGMLLAYSPTFLFILLLFFCDLSVSNQYGEFNKYD